MTAEVRVAAARIESGAALAPLARDSVMRGVFRRAGKGRTARRSPQPPRLKPFPARLFLLGLPNRKGADAARRPHEFLQARDDEELSSEVMLFGGIKLLRLLLVGCGLALLIMGEEIGQRSRFTLRLGWL